MSGQKVLIVGGVAGGASTAARLRRLSEQSQIIMFERGEYISFANCGLPYFIGGEITEKQSLTLQTPKSFNSRFNVDVRVLNEVVSIDRKSKNVTVKDLKSNQTYKESYDKLVLSMGAKPILPNIEGINSSKVFTLRNIPDTYNIKDFVTLNAPKSAVVVGGGYIGVEMAENLKSNGLDVTIVEMSDQIISPIDFDMACDVHKHIEGKGVKLVFNNAVKAIKETSNGLSVNLNNGEIQTDMLIMAVGVQPESEIAKECGLAVNERGCIIVSNDMKTSDDNIYAVGDAIEVNEFVTNQKAFIPLAGPANKQGRIVADRIAASEKSGDDIMLESNYTGTQGSSILKAFDMTVAATGINEKTAKKLGLDYEKVFTYSASHASYYPGAVNMSVKTIFEKKSGKILGAQIVGFDGVDKRCDVIATAIRFGATASDLTKLELCYAPPYSSAKDPVNMAGFVIENILTNKVKIFHWHDIKNLTDKKDVILLDVRTKAEYENGTIDGFINIPVDELRNRLDELDKNKTIYITCQIGLRGYIAARLLKQNGYDVYNFSGGYRLYSSIFSKIENPPSPIGLNPETQQMEQSEEKETTKIKLDACGLQCPGPIVKLSKALNEATEGDVIEISTTDPAFASDIQGYCRRTGNIFEGLSSSKGISVATIKKGKGEKIVSNEISKDGKNLIVFSGDLDKAIASFIIANASAAMGRKVSMFFTFWGLNILRNPKKVSVKKDFLSSMFGFMMPRGSKRLGLSKMNMGSMGAKMIRHIMKKKNVDSLEDLIKLAMENGVEIVACSMSMDVMGIKQEELIPGVKIGGAAAMLAHAEESDMSLFI